MPKVAPFFLLLLLVYFLCLNTAKVVHLFAYQKEQNAYSLSFAFSFTHYIYTRARALPGCVRLDYALPHHNTTHHAHQGSSFWSILDASVFSFLSSRESGIYRGEGRRFRILDSQRLPFGASWTLLVSLSSRESGICDERVEGLRILDSQGLCLQEHFVRFSLRESRIRGQGAWRCGIGDSQRGLLRGGGTSFPSFKSLFSYLLNSEFVFDKPQSVIGTGILHIAFVVGGDALHHLSVAVIAGDLYGCTRLSSSLMSTQWSEEILHAVVQSHYYLHFLFLLLSLFPVLGKPFPQFLLHLKIIIHNSHKFKILNSFRS